MLHPSLVFLFMQNVYRVLNDLQFGLERRLGIVVLLSY